MNNIHHGASTWVTSECNNPSESRRGPETVILEVSLDGLWTLSFGLSQCHCHGSWRVCEVALSAELMQFGVSSAFQHHTCHKGLTVRVSCQISLRELMDSLEGLHKLTCRKMFIEGYAF